MQILIFLLVLLNALFFAFSHGLSGQGASADAQRLNQQISPERIEILSRNTPPESTQTCLSWLLPSPSAAQSIADKIDKIQNTPKIESDIIPVTEPTWWVAITGLSNAAEASKKAAQVRALGVEAFSQVDSGTDARFALSFGVFTSETAAQAQLEKLKASGVRSATVVAQAPTNTVRLQVRGQPAQLPALQTAVKKWLPESLADGPQCF